MMFSNKITREDIDKWKVVDIKQFTPTQDVDDTDPLTPIFPFRMLASAPSGSGKSTAIFKLLFNLEFDDLYVFCIDPTEEQYELLEECMQVMGRNCHISNDLSEIPDPMDFDKERRSIVIFDDLVNVKNKEVVKKIADMFIMGRKRNISCIYISHSYKQTPDMIRKNSNYFLIWRLPQRNEITEIGKVFRDILTMEDFYNLYDIATKDPYSFLFIDKTNNPKAGRFRKNFSNPILLSGIDF